MTTSARIAAVLGATIAITLTGCGHSEPDAYTNTAKSSTPGLFTVPADQMQHLQLYAVQPSNMQRVLRLTGTVAYNQFRTSPVISPVGGPVARIVVVPGQKVKRGEAMLYIASPDFAQLRATYIKALDAFRVADKNYARAEDLYAHHAIAEKDLLDAESARAQSQADLQSAQQSLRVLGVNDPNSVLKSSAAPEIPLVAPLAGEATELLVNPGQLLQAGQTQCFTISDMSTVWVLVNIYQNDLPYVRVGDAVAIQTDAYPHPFQGRISFVSAALDPTSRTLQARIVTENPHEELKKDMYVSTTVTAGTITNALTVPDAAVLRDAENQPYVYLAMGNDQFAQRSVNTGMSTNGVTQITSGLKSGDKVVAQGALFLQFANSLQQ